MLPKLSNKQISQHSRYYESSPSKYSSSCKQSVCKSSISHKDDQPKKQICRSECETQKREISQMIKNYEQKIAQQVCLNKKLKQLYRIIKDDYSIKSSANQGQQELINLKKQIKKLQIQRQNSSHLLNLLISQNNKLKEVVTKERNQRAVYFNIYKNLQHQIYKQQTKYKHLLIQELVCEGAANKIKQKFKKGTKKIEKQIQTLDQQLHQLNKKEKKQIPQIQIDSKQPQKQIRQKKTRAATNLSVFMTQKTDNQNQKDNKNTDKKSNYSNQMQEDQKQLNIEQIKFEIQTKKLQIDGVQKRLANASINNQENIQSLISQLEHIDDKIQEVFTLYETEQLKQKQYQDIIGDLQRKIYQKQITAEQIPLQRDEKSQDSLVQQQQQLEKLQNKLSEVLGIKVKNMNNQLIKHYSQKIYGDRMNQMQQKQNCNMKKKTSSKQQSKRTLDKSLDLSFSNKVDFKNNISPGQMHSRMLYVKNK